MAGEKPNSARAMKTKPRRKPRKPELSSADASKEEKRVWKKMDRAVSPKKGTAEWEDLHRRMRLMRKNAKRTRKARKSQARNN